LKSVFSKSLFSAEVFSHALEPTFQQDGAGTVLLKVVQVLKEWHTLKMYGGGGNKTAAQNASAFAGARDVLWKGGTLTVTPDGPITCDPVNWVREDIYNGSMIIEGVSNPSGGLYTNSTIVFNGTGPGKFWNFDSPVAGLNNGSRWTVRNLYIRATQASFSGDVISMTTPVTDGSKIQFYSTVENCLLVQDGGGSASGCLINIGKAIGVMIERNNLVGGAVQIRGQQGLTVAGTVQPRQSTTVTVRKNRLSGCNGYPILWGGEGWGLYDNIFQASHGGRGRAFYTNANYPIKGMSWLDNWFGDFTATDAEQMIVVHGLGFTFKRNIVGGTWAGSGNPWTAIHMDGVRVFDISTNIFDYCSAPITVANTPRLGVIEANGYNIVDDEFVTGALHASVRNENNGLAY
jgi:hypothetical protein